LVVQNGAVTIPTDYFEAHGWRDGTVLVVLDGDDGLLITSRDDLERKVQADLARTNLVDELLRERREAARRENEEIDN
jgi:bifunctional DNA-binding transcriptional regulator/antitoxin component of YhaV-PrlF toxin-antitoxin module